MNEPRGADGHSLLSVASSISEGVPVAWDHAAAAADDTTAALLDELRVVEDVAHASQGQARSWGSFTILGELGHGNYGTVYRVLDTDLNLEMALKVLRPRQSTHLSDAGRALNEARLLAQVSHPNVVRIYRVERRGDDVGVAMELLHGRTLDDLVVHQGPFSAGEAMLIGADICRGLAAVHGARLVHGDIKAQNVMRASGGRTVLMDFGAGYDVKVDAAAAHRLTGTPLYLAPEVFAGNARTQVADIYSVGVLLYYLATGTFPVDGETGADVKRKHFERLPRRRLRDVRADLPAEFIHVVERATHVDPSCRHQTAGEFEEALNQALRLDAALTGEVDVPRPRSRPSRLLVTALASAAVLALAVMTWRTPETAPAATPGSPAVASAGLVTPPAPQAADAEAPYRIQAAFYRVEGSREVRLGAGARVARRDRLALHVTSSVPTYVYVINEDDRGESYLLFPLPGLRTTNPLPAGSTHLLPGASAEERVYWTVSSTGGREHFLIFASPQPLSPAFQGLIDALPHASAERAITPQRMSSAMVGALRGVGGLVKGPPVDAQPGLRAEFGVPLPAGEETARGVWVRQLTLDNPGR